MSARSSVTSLDTLLLSKINSFPFGTKSLFDITAARLCIHGTKDDVDLLKRALFRFWDEQRNEDTHGETEDCEHDKCAPADTVDGKRRDFGYDEIEKPLRGGYSDSQIEHQTKST